MLTKLRWRLARWIAPAPIMRAFGIDFTAKISSEALIRGLYEDPE